MKGGVIIRRKNIEELEWASINPTLKAYKPFCSEFSFNDKNYMDFEWIESQLEYINNLSQRQKDIVYSYTKYGDVLINNYLRNTLSDDILNTTKQYIQENRTHPMSISNLLVFDTKQSLLQSINTVISELRQIILNAPRPKKPIKVFRGIKDSNHLSLLKPQILNGFLSTTLYLPSTELFMDDNCCLLELYLNTNVPCLFIAPISKEPGEYEILLKDLCTINIVEQSIKKYLDIPNFHTVPNLLDIASRYELDEKTVFECIISV
jgi:hypothetical protein